MPMPKVYCISGGWGVLCGCANTCPASSRVLHAPFGRGCVSLTLASRANRLHRASSVSSRGRWVTRLTRLCAASLSCRPSCRSAVASPWGWMPTSTELCLVRLCPAMSAARTATCPVCAPRDTQLVALVWPRRANLVMHVERRPHDLFRVRCANAHFVAARRLVAPPRHRAVHGRPHGVRR